MGFIQLLTTEVVAVIRELVPRSSMESRVRRLNQSVPELPFFRNDHGEGSYRHSTAGPNRSRLYHRAVQVVLVGCCLCVLVLQWYSGQAAQATLGTTVEGGAERVARPNNGWMKHLRHIENKEPPKVSYNATAEDKIYSFAPPKTEALSADEATHQRRAPYDPSRHSADQKKVVDMIKWAWKGYDTYAYGHDALNVRDMNGMRTQEHDAALTLVDSLDTLFLVGMFEEFDKASEWVKANLKDRMYQPGYISVFETTIRVLGGLLSAFYLSGQPHLLTAANEVGAALSPAFEKHTHGFPDKSYETITRNSYEASTLAEVGTLQLEFKYLAQLTGITKYKDQVERISDSLARDVAEKYPDGLLPMAVSQHNGRVSTAKVTLGANGDSYFEYLLKQWLFSGKKEDKFKQQYLIAVNGITNKLVAKSQPNGYVFIGELVNDRLDPKMDHLVCFVPGMLALGYLHGMPESHLKLAEELTETCYQMYAQMATKLAPEIVYFNTNKDAKEDIRVSPRDAFNLLRPETVESLMIMYRVTKNEKYREYGREIVAAFEKECRLPHGGYASISNVVDGPAAKPFRDEMESFFVAETLKYLFLLFSDDSVFSLDEIVFNTEAHPFPIQTGDANAATETKKDGANEAHE